MLQHLTSVRALREGGHRTVLRLEPEHLGEVTVTVDVRSGDVRMAVSGGAEALAAVREGLPHLRTSLADSGLDLGDVALRPDAAGPAAPPGSAATSGPGLDGGDAGSPPRPDPGAGSPNDEPRSGREQARADRPDTPELDPLPRRATPRVPADIPVGGTGRPRRLDVRV